MFHNVQRTLNKVMYFLRLVYQVHSYANTNASQRSCPADLVIVIGLLLQKWNNICQRYIINDWPMVYYPLASYQIRKIVGCAFPGNAGNVFSTPTSKKTASWRSRHASRHVHHACTVMHFGIANPRWLGRRSRHSRCMHNPQFYLSGKRSIAGNKIMYKHVVRKVWHNGKNIVIVHTFLQYLGILLPVFHHIMPPAILIWCECFISL